MGNRLRKVYFIFSFLIKKLVSFVTINYIISIERLTMTKGVNMAIRTEQNGISIELWTEHTTTHVRVHDHDYRGRLLWDSFETGSKAQNAFDRCINFFHAETARKPMNMVLSRDGSKLSGNVSCSAFHANGFYMNANTRLTTK